MGCGFKLKKRLTSSGLNRAYLKHFYGFTLEELESLDAHDELAYLMAIDVITARQDLRAMRTNNLYGTTQDSREKLTKELIKQAYPHAQKKVHTFDEIEKLFKGN